ncbi:MAG: glycoside hydrolase family 18 protein [Deltaproteobacteria bacterium]|nr:glycoside hydrolase family 18 protein [Deltaproteobacteria bacterium]
MRTLTTLLVSALLGACGAASAGGGDASTTDPDAAPGADSAPRPDAAPGDPGHWVSGYYVGYQRDLYPPAAVDFASLTHLIVGRVTPTATGGLTTTFDIDATQGPAMAIDLADRAHAAHVKAVLMVGGAGEHDGWVGAASAAHRAAFVQALLDAMDAYHYDGVDLDWEPIEAADEAPLTALVHDLRAARPGMIITMPLGWVNANFPDVSAVYAQLAPDLDQLNLMSYSMADGWEGWSTWHSSALAGQGGTTPSSVSSSLEAYVAGGVPAAKLGAGIGFYGSCWTGGATGPGQSPNGSGVVASDNEMSFAAIMNTYYQQAAYHYDTAADAPYLAWAGGHGPRGCTFLSYEDERSIAAKGAFVRAHGYGGAMIWTINQGYRAGAPAGQRNTVLSATAAAVLP